MTRSGLDMLTSVCFLSEGSSPGMVCDLLTGFGSLEDLSYGGWDGRYALKENDENPDVRLYQAAKGNEKGTRSGCRNPE